MTEMDAASRAQVAETAFIQGDRLVELGRLDDARAAYTAAHDVVLDLPVLHREAHVRLLPVHQALGLRGAVLEDRVLLLLAPVGVFRLAAWALSLKAKLRGRALYPA